jgi:hypothetical protein
MNPVYLGKWVVSIAIEYHIGAYSWRKFIGDAFERIKR